MNIIDDIKLQYKIGGVANKLIYWNVGIFLISIILFYQFKILQFDYPVWISLSSNVTNALYFPYTLVSYMFLHGSFLHLFSNMLILNFSSRLFLTYFNEKQLIGLYFLGGIFAGLCYLGLSGLIGFGNYIVGASGAIMALLLATTTYQPLMNVRLLLIGNVKLWHLTGVILLLFLLSFWANTGGNIAHFGGAFFGIVYIKLLQNGTDLSKIVTRFLDFFANLFKKSPRQPKSNTQMNYTRNTNRTQTTTNINQKQIDEILDKISKSGYDSLTNAEKELLFRAGREN